MFLPVLKIQCVLTWIQIQGYVWGERLELINGESPTPLSSCVSAQYQSSSDRNMTYLKSLSLLLTHNTHMSSSHIECTHPRPTFLLPFKVHPKGSTPGVTAD